MYRDRLKGMQILLSRTQAGPGRAVKQEQEQTSRNHVQAFWPISVFENIQIRNTFIIAIKSFHEKRHFFLSPSKENDTTHVDDSDRIGPFVNA